MLQQTSYQLQRSRKSIPVSAETTSVLPKFPWVLPIYHYADKASLLQSLKEHVIDPAEQKARELEKGLLREFAPEKAKRLETP